MDRVTNIISAVEACTTTDMNE